MMFLFIPFIYGLFYDFAVYLIAMIFIVILFVFFIKKQKIKIYFNYCFFSICILSIAALLTCIWGVDKQDSIFGFFRVLTILIFIIILMQQEELEIREYYKIIPISGVLMLIFCFIFKFIPNMFEYFYSSNGRLGGFFQYSNTFALFLLIGINILMYNVENKKSKILSIIILLIGIFLTGSRTVFILTLLTFGIYLFTGEDKKEKITLSIVLLITIILSLIVVGLTKDFQTIGRYLTTSLNSSTLWGRIIYYKDAFMLLKQNIFGYGYMGYSYIYPMVQSANYAVKFVHNDFLQLALDFGIIPMIIFLGTIIYSIFSKRTDKLQKTTLIILFLHMLIDFDLQFLIMFLILVVMQDLSKQKDFEIKIQRNVPIFIALIVVALIYAYLGIATFANYIDNNILASKMLSNYTQARVRGLINEKDLNKANKLANEIIDNNEYIKVAYNTKSLYQLKNKNYNKACEYKEKAIELDKYNPKEYEDYITLLSQILQNTVIESDEINTSKYIKKVIEIPRMIEVVKKNSTGLAIKIRDSSDIELNEQTLQYINNMRSIMKR